MWEARCDGRRRPPRPPAAAGRRHGHAYACGAAVDHPTLWGPAQTLVKLSAADDASASSPDAPLREAAVWAPGPRQFTQEPVFVPRTTDAAEGDSWLLCTIFRGAENRSDLAMFEATGIEQGPVALAHLSSRVPAAA